MRPANDPSIGYSLEEINERFRREHSVRRVRKGRKAKDANQTPETIELVPGGVPPWNEAKSLKQDYRCRCRGVIRKDTFHALNIETGQRLCMVCATDIGLPRSLFAHYGREQ